MARDKQGKEDIRGPQDPAERTGHWKEHDGLCQMALSIFFFREMAEIRCAFAQILPRPQVVGTLVRESFVRHGFTKD